MDTIEFKCTVNTSDANTTPLLVSFLLDNNVVCDSTEITGPTEIKFDINDDDDAEHSIKVVIAGKTTEHTTVNESGEIVSDTHLIFNDFFVDDINIDHMLLINPWPYKHNFNGNGDETVDQFYDVAGCNGEIEFKFTTPFYLWLLENM